MPFNRLDKLILLLTSGILFYSFLVDFILRMYKFNPWINLCIRLQEYAYWAVVTIVIICVVIISLKNTDRSNVRYFFKKLDKKNLIFVAVLLILSSVRLLSLDAMPLHLDESDSAFWPAKQISDYGPSYFRSQNYANVPINSPNNHGAATYILLCSFNMHFFKNPVLVVRVVSAVIGILTVILTFFLIKDLYGLRVGLLSSLFLALFPWHVLQSRVGFNGEILVPLFSLLIFYSFNKSLKGENAEFLFLTSVFLGIGGFYIHISSRIFLVIILLLIMVYYKKLTRYSVKTMLLSILIFLLFLYPHLAMRMYNTDYQLNSAIQEHTKLSLENYASNINSEFKILLIDYGADELMYFQHFPKPIGPLLDTTLAITLILAFLYYIYRKEINSIFFVWLVTPILCIPVLDYVASKYLLSLLPVLLIFVSKFLNDLVKEPYFRIKKNVVYRKLPSVIALLMTTLILLSFICSLAIFLKNIPALAIDSPYSLSKQAIEFLFEKKIKDDKFIIFEDALISVSKSHVWYLLFLKGDDRPSKDIKEHILPRSWVYHPTTGTWTNDFPIKGRNWADFEKDYLKRGFTIYYLIWDHLGENYYNGTYKNGKTTETGVWLNPFDTGIPSPCLELFNKIHKDEKPIKTIKPASDGFILNVYEITPQDFLKND